MQMCWKKIGIGVAVCLAIGIVAMSRSVGREAPEHTPGNTEIQEHTTAHQQPVQTQTSHMYDSAFFVSLIQDTCEQVLPLTNLSVEIQEDGVLAVSGLLQKEQAKKRSPGCATSSATQITANSNWSLRGMCWSSRKRRPAKGPPTTRCIRPCSIFRTTVRRRFRPPFRP